MRPLVRVIRLTVPALAALLCLVLQAQSNKPSTPYSSMAPIDRYLTTDTGAEISLAKSAAPKSISDSAEVMLFERQGFRTAVKGTNGFVCMVQRSWAAGVDDPEFWNPGIRAPICFNAPAARTYLPRIIAKTRLALAGKSRTQIAEAIRAALDKGELPTPEIGAMCYMMSKDGHLNDRDGHWHPHLMFFVPLTEEKAWGANLPGSPILGALDATERVTVFLVPVSKWSDGAADSHDRN
jgi:hypothetical protein